MELEFRYPNIPPAYIPDQNLIGIYEPHTFPSPKDEKDIIKESLAHPIASPQIREIASQTHWLGTSYDRRGILGQAENPVRQEIDTIATKAGLALIVNAIQDARGKGSLEYLAKV